MYGLSPVFVTPLAQGVTVSFEESALSVEETAGTLSVPVVLSEARTQATTLSVVTTASTADANADYSAGPYSVTIPANETQASVDITILDDATPESAETFLVSLTGPPTGVTLGSPGTMTVTINANTESPQVRFPEAQYRVEVWEGADATVTVSLSEGSASATTVTLASGTSTATADVDYVDGPWTVTIPAGETSGTALVRTTQDNVLESNGEFIGLTISSVSAGVAIGTPSTARVDILDDEFTFCFSLQTYVVREDAGEVVATVNMTRPALRTMNFYLRYLDFNATPKEDYTPVHATAATGITVVPGQENVVFRIPIVDDDEREQGETFRLFIASPALPDDVTECSVDIIILDNDTPAVSIEADVSKVAEGTSATYTLTASPAPTEPLTVNLTVTDAPGANYVAPGDEGARMVTLGAGGTASVSVTTQTDTNDEPSGPVTVENDDGPF